MSNWVALVFLAVLNFFVAPIVVRSLGETQYGIWVLLGSLVGYMGLLDLGVRGAVVRYVARFRAAADHESANRLYGSALRIFAITGALAIVISGVLAALVGTVFNIPAEFLITARIVTVLVGANIAVSLVGGVVGGVLAGIERFDLGNIVEIGLTTVRSVAVVVGLKLGHGLVFLACLQIAASALRVVCCGLLLRRLYPELQLVSWRWDKDAAQSVLKFGLAATFLQAMGSIMIYNDALIIGAYLPIGMITYFAIAGNLHDYARSAISGISTTVTPRISALQTQDDFSAVQSALLRSGRLATVVILPIAMTFVLRGSTFIGLWMGPQYAELSGQVLAALAFCLMPIAGYQLVTVAMLGLNRHAALIPMFVGEAVCNVVLSVLLVRHWGVLGTAVGTLVPRLAVSAVIGPYYAQRALGIPLRQFWTHVFIIPFASMLPFGAATWIVERLAPAHNLHVFFLQVAALLPVAAISAFFVCFSPIERTSLLRRLSVRQLAA